MASGDYDSALPVALEAVTLGEQLFKPQPALQLFPLYLLAAQVCPTASNMPWPESWALTSMECRWYVPSG